MGIFSNHFKQFTSWIDPAGAFIGRETGIADYFVKPGPPGPPPAMPDQATILQQQNVTAAQSAAAQYGRAATVLTGTGQSSAGDRLGP